MARKGFRRRVITGGVWAGAVLVLASTIAQLCVWPAHLVERMALRHEMKERILAGLPLEALTVFRFTEQELAGVDFEDGGKELRIDGSMYDIVRSFQDGQGRQVIHAVRDDRETEWKAGLDRLVRERMAADDQGRNDRERIIASWAMFYEPIEAVRTPVPTMKELAFAQLTCADGREIGAIDPGPPRRG